MDPSIVKELRQLVAAKVISEETAVAIQQYYQSKAAEPSNRFTIALGILGALLVGLGIVLVIAHNWDEFGRSVKTIFAFLPLVLGQVLCLYTLLRRRDNFVWRESSAVLLFFGIPASIALTSQIYHLGGSLSDMVLAWMLLAAPLIYLLSSYITSLLYIAGVTWYACLVGYSLEYLQPSHYPYLYVPLMLVVAPAYLRLLKAQNNLFHLHNWVIAGSVACAFGAFAQETGFYWVGYLSLCCLYYQIGSGMFFRQFRLYANPFLLLSVPAILITLLAWSYDWFWELSELFEYIKWSEPFMLMTILMLLAIAIIWGRRYSRKEWSGVSPVEFSAYVFLLAHLVYVDENTTFSLVLINLWVLVLGLYYTRKGSIRHHLGILNLGLLIIAALAVLRFFDETIPFVWRGIFFLSAGIGFFLANYLVIKRKKSLAILNKTE
ncbi:MAG TPA: DUF2157 domain-containing protein [Chitinophagaceae bacterium]|nr:DUF2157 domain-containing protein [Chitinophagaceae bacterium]